jgi:hypothetical protein
MVQYCTVQITDEQVNRFHKLCVDSRGVNLFQVNRSCYKDTGSSSSTVYGLKYGSVKFCSCQITVYRLAQSCEDYIQ